MKFLCTSKYAYKNYSTLAALATGLGNAIFAGNINNLNIPTDKTGITIAMWRENAQNAPFNYGALLQVIADYYGFQIAINSDSGYPVCVRGKNVNGWSSWKTLSITT